MHIKCSKEKLIDGLNIVLKAVPARTTMPILECVLVEAKNNFINLVANNLEMGIETSQIDADVDVDSCIAVDAKIFSEIIKKIPGSDVLIDVENNQATIKGGRAEFKIPVQSGDDFPKLPEIDRSDSYKISCESFKNMIRQTMFAVSQDESKPVLTGELLEIKDGKINMVALDGFRIAFRSAKIDENAKDISVVIPAKSLSDLIRVLSVSNKKEITRENREDENSTEEKISVYFTDKHALFELKSCRVVTRLIDGKFLKYESIFTDECKTNLTVSRHDFLDSIERAALISTENKKNPVKLAIDNSKVIVTSNTDLQTSYEELDAVTDGESLEIAFNPKYLMDVLKALDCENVNIKFTTLVNPCVIKPVSDTDAKYLILPLRLKE